MCLSRCALYSGLVTRVSLRSLSTSIYAVSCLRVLTLNKCLRLFLTLPVRYLLMCSRPTFFMFMANVFWKSLKAAQFFDVLHDCTRLLSLFSSAFSS